MPNMAYDSGLRNAQSGQGRAQGPSHILPGQQMMGGMGNLQRGNPRGVEGQPHDNDGGAGQHEDGSEFTLPGEAVGQAVGSGMPIGASQPSRGLGGRSRRNIPIPRENFVAYPSAALVNQEQSSRTKGQARREGPRVNPAVPHAAVRTSQAAA